MDGSTLGALIGIVKAIPDSKITQAEAAADRAEAARDEAIEHSYGVSISQTQLIFTVSEGGGS